MEAAFKPGTKLICEVSDGHVTVRWSDGDDPHLLDDDVWLTAVVGADVLAGGILDEVAVRTTTMGTVVGVPVRFTDGDSFGVLCAVKHPPGPRDGRREYDFLEVLARLVAQHLEEGHLREKELRSARARILDVVDHGAMRTVFQPIVDIGRGATVGLEALSRISLEPGKPPNVWFDEAEAVGLGVELQMIAVRSALAALPVLPHGFIAVNVSPSAIRSDDFIRALDRLPPQQVVVEVTEHARIDDYSALERALRPLRERGMRVAVDDCGAGFANLLHLLRLQPEIIKLDIGIVRNIDSDAVRRALAGSLVGFAFQMGATIIAEGIETEAELHALREIGVPWGQGFLLARPAPYDELAPFD